MPITKPETTPDIPSLSKPATTLRNDRDKKQFVLQIGDTTAYIDYKMENGIYHLVHSEVPVALRGNGLGEELVQRSFEAIANEGRQGVAHCGFIKSVAKRSEKWRDIIVC